MLINFNIFVRLYQFYYCLFNVFTHNMIIIIIMMYETDKELLEKSPNRIMNYFYLNEQKLISPTLPLIN